MNYARSIRFLSIGTLFALVSSTGCSQQEDSNDTVPADKNKTEASPAPVLSGKLSLNKLIVALKANKDPEAMLEEKDALQKYLADKLGIEVRVIIPTSSAAILEGFANKTIDVGYLSSTDAARNLAQETASILLVHLRNGKPHYDSVWLSLKDKEYESIKDLKGKSVAFAKRSSTSGFLIPLRDLHERGLINEKIGLKDFFSKTIYGNGYESAVEKVLSGEAEAAAVSDYVYFGDNHLNDEQKAKLKIIQRQGPVPSHTICYRLSLSNEDRDLMRATLLAMNEDNPELRDKVFNGELVEVNPQEHLKVTREALKIEAQYEEFLEKRNSLKPSLIGLLVLLGVALVFFMTKATRKANF